MYYVWLFFEAIVKYTFLCVLLSMAILFILMILMYQRDRVMGRLRFPILEEKFVELCDFADNLDAPYNPKKRFGSGSWMGDLILKGAICAFGLMIIWIILLALKG